MVENNNNEMTAINFLVPVELKQDLEERSNELGLTQSGIIRMLLNKHLREEKGELV